MTGTMSRGVRHFLLGGLLVAAQMLCGNAPAADAPDVFAHPLTPAWPRRETAGRRARPAWPLRAA